MNLYEWEGKLFLASYGIAVPRAILVRAGDDARAAFRSLGSGVVVVKAQTIQGKRGKRGGIHVAEREDDVVGVCERFLTQPFGGEQVTSVLIEERLAIAREYYLAITYDAPRGAPIVLWGEDGGTGVEGAPEASRRTHVLDIRAQALDLPYPFVRECWRCFQEHDCRLLEVNPLIETTDGRWVAVDAKVVLDDDAAFRHPEWAASYSARSPLGRPPTDRERAAATIDAGAQYYRGTASKYIELDGDIAVLFAGGGASLAGIDALERVGLRPANYTEYSGNPPREKVAALTRIVLSKPGIRGFWIAGGVANFTDVAETFHGIVDVLEALRPPYPIVVRRAGPNDAEGMRLLDDCASQYGLTIRRFGKEVSMDEAVGTLATLVADRERIGATHAATAEHQRVWPSS